MLGTDLVVQSPAKCTRETSPKGSQRVRRRKDYVNKKFRRGPTHPRVAHSCLSTIASTLLLVSYYYTRLGVCPVLERGECKLRLLTFRIRSEIGSELLSSRIVLQGPPTGMTTQDQLGRNLPLPPAHSASGACRPLLASCRPWNGLPDYMKSIVSVREFKRMLRVSYFG